MENLYYSYDEKKLFWIAGYTDNTDNVKTIVSMLTNNRNFFIRQCNLPENTIVNTYCINRSRRYKSMRCFWADDVETPPEDAFVIGKGDVKWTMQGWIGN